MCLQSKIQLFKVAQGYVAVAVIGSICLSALESCPTISCCCCCQGWLLLQPGSLILHNNRCYRKGMYRFDFTLLDFLLPEWNNNTDLFRHSYMSPNSPYETFFRGAQAPMKLTIKYILDQSKNKVPFWLHSLWLHLVTCSRITSMFLTMVILRWV